MNERRAGAKKSPGCAELQRLTRLLHERIKREREGKRIELLKEEDPLRLQGGISQDDLLDGGDRGRERRDAGKSADLPLSMQEGRCSLQALKTCSAGAALKKC